MGKKESSQHQDFIDHIDFLCSISSTQKNNKIITQYYLSEFAESPKIFGDFIIFIKDQLKSSKIEKQKKIAGAYLQHLSFLCERFGLYEDKLELDDLCFQITKPKEYQELSIRLKKYKKESTKLIDSIYDIFKKCLKENKIKAKLKGRYKNIYSIYKKCAKKKNMDILRLNDIFAFRIITETNEDCCFEILNILHNKFTPIPDRFKDYVSIPKINGYQSLHTGLYHVTQDLDLAIEVQIRTKSMDEIAESGVAAHYLYAKNKKSTLDNKKEKKLFEHITRYKKIEKNMYCLTPNGDIVILPQNSQVIEFANKIHSKLGKSTQHALVNGKKEGIAYRLENYDMVELIIKK